MKCTASAFPAASSKSPKALFRSSPAPSSPPSTAWKKKDGSPPPGATRRINGAPSITASQRPGAGSSSPKPNAGAAFRSRLRALSKRRNTSSRRGRTAMAMLSRFTSLLRNLFQRRRSDEALDAEVHGYVDMLADEKIRAGMNPEDARRAARIELGGVEQTKEQVREVRAGAWLEILVQDLRYGVRTLGRSAGSTVIAVLTLALGIGANTAIFSVIDTALLRPLPYPNPDRIAMLYARSPNGETGELSPADFLDYKNELQSFEYLAGIRESSFNLAGEDRPERVAGTVVTPEFFAVMGRRAQIGRTLIPEQDKPSASRTMVLSYSLWQHRFGGDPAILGRSVYVDNIPRIVVGVMPPNFQFPGESELWLSPPPAAPDQPLNPAADLSADRDSHYFDTI